MKRADWLMTSMAEAEYLKNSPSNEAKNTSIKNKDSTVEKIEEAQEKLSENVFNTKI